MGWQIGGTWRIGPWWTYLTMATTYQAGLPAYVFHDVLADSICQVHRSPQRRGQRPAAAPATSISTPHYATSFATNHSLALVELT
jgi:hypothetical protein